MKERERRQFKRQVLVMFLHVFDSETGKVLGYLGDISTHGLLLISETPIEVDKKIIIGVRLQKLEADLHYVDMTADKHFCCMAQSRWTGKIDHELYATGFMLLEPSDSVIQEIQQIIIRIGKEETSPTHKYVDAMLRLDKTLSQTERADIAQDIQALHGVAFVSFQEDLPHVLIVEHNIDEISASTILQHLNQQQIKAELVTLKG
ncbi:PilZ domain-containing protein [Beggiatoa alba B18LD]|uniref:PilZ domain-containing protein n=1 Tax=Beggiatoa alba B18LD TaxID=395493 RepID=I3CFE3_9GAMM|nr:PilZ domain-containing protein [Beggiatoa alba]EIJ42336.1 PilZ domain-containing protein [Beggiatoa alba B18LD]